MTYFILVMLFAIAIAVFAVQNATPVSVRFMFWGFNSSLALVILGSAVAGALATGVASVRGRLRVRHRIKELEIYVRKLESQIQSFPFQQDKSTANGGGGEI